VNWAAAFLMATFLVASGYEAAIQYFTRTRNVGVSHPDRQNYFVADQDIWKFARPDLADIRFYDGQAQVPYALVKQSAENSSQESPAKILNLGSVSGHAEFDLDVGGLPEYSRVRLELQAKNFINAAKVQGRSSLNDRSGTDLGSSTLYDFTVEGLGSNSTLKLPVSSFPYLHVRLAPGIDPHAVKGAYISKVSETKAAWLPAGECRAVPSSSRQSAFECTLFDGMPVERLSFELPANAVNFNRTVIVSDEKGSEFQRGAISRVRMNRASQAVVSENLTVDLFPPSSRQIKVAIENGDDAPLPIRNIQPLSVERRFYFDPKGATALKLYYGNPRLGPPSYDYGKFFQQSADAAIAQLAPAEANSQFTGLPDDRPWSERHNGVLWIAMLIAVALLGGLALRGFKSSGTS